MGSRPSLSERAGRAYAAARFGHARLEATARLRQARWFGWRGQWRLRGLAWWAPPAWGVASSFLLSGRADLLARSPFADPGRVQRLESASRTRMADALEDMQHAYFHYPWLGAATIHLATRLGTWASRLTRAVLCLTLVLRIGDRPATQKRLAQVPVDGYDAFMAAWMAFTEASGLFRAGDVHIRPLVLSRADPPPPRLSRLGVPADLPDVLEDIDDLTYTATYGSLLKIVRVGDVEAPWRRPLRSALNRVTGRAPRWIVEIPGTDHLTMATTANPADPQANMLEILGHPSNQRRAVHLAILDAMTRAGVNPDNLSEQRVLLAGHSQGAMIAMALAGQDDVPYRIEAVVSAGGPIGRMPAPAGVGVLALRHLQDPIPLFGGIAGEVDPRIVVFERSLPPSESGVLYYAHAANTYAATARVALDYCAHVPDSAVARMIERIAPFFPQRTGLGVEPGRVFCYELYQDVVPAAPREKRKP